MAKITNGNAFMDNNRAMEQLVHVAAEARQAGDTAKAAEANAEFKEREAAAQEYVQENYS